MLKHVESHEPFGDPWMQPPVKFKEPTIKLSPQASVKKFSPVEELKEIAEDPMKLVDEAVNDAWDILRNDKPLIDKIEQ